LLSLLLLLLFFILFCFSVRFAVAQIIM
jgi:hypothetical protein